MWFISYLIFSDEFVIKASWELDWQPIYVIIDNHVHSQYVDPELIIWVQSDFNGL